jgi:putative PIN family toxin of toxin-antitoxin system
MADRPLVRLVIETNVIVRYLIGSGSIPHLAILKAQSRAVFLSSNATFAELAEVLRRAKFDKYTSRADRENALQRIASISSFLSSPLPIRACRDPKDDKFLELAVHGRADAIVTSDQDLLTLNPFRGIAILTPADYLNAK